MTTPNKATFNIDRKKYLGNVQRDMERWRKGYDEIMTGSLPISNQDKAEMRRTWLEFEAAYRDLQASDEAGWQAMQRRTQRSAQAFRDTWVIVAKRIELEDQDKIGWLRGFTDDLTTSSAEGWLEGMGEQTDASEGWTEGMGEKSTVSEGWTEGYEKTR